MSLTSIASAETKAELKTILARPLIVGASVSGDYLTPSPGKVLALRYTSSDQIKVVARKGKPGKDVLKEVSESTFKDRTAIIGIDLFFWDSFAPSPAESLKSLDRIIGFAKAQNIPIILGEVPALMPQMQKSLIPLNKKITEVCHSYSLCKILPLNSILLKTVSDGYVMQGGTKYTLDKLIPDGLHIAKPASEYLADQIQLLL